MEKEKAAVHSRAAGLGPSHVPLGIRELIAVDRVLIKQKHNGFRVGNKYVISRADGNVVLTAKEERSFIMGSGNRSFRFHVLDNQGTEVVTLHRPWSWTMRKMEVHMSGRPASLVRQKRTWMDTVLNIHDAADDPVMRVKGSSMDTTFEIQTLNKSVIGGISKVYDGLLKEMFSTLDTFVVTFPVDLDVRYKATLIGTCILIDFLKYEGD